MFNSSDLQRRDLPVMLDGGRFLTLRVATVSAGLDQTIYQGYAYPGSSEADPVWLIQRTTIGNDGTVSTLFANGVAVFDQIWANRTALTYA
ncbi:hypothetical protein [Candidatus Magnetaquicoccus inordinatus]|uniref:hypothetical protein n=1 Tax=Candidatus Magnetaquicoccus inordinatus TaxID=2496818 RepID=UPI00102C7562|nr:hypothetical protein [Candidatus Magnetaquicoccus inordinatus]